MTDAWTLCSVTPVPTTLVSETRPRWIEVWVTGSTPGHLKPTHLEPIGPFDGSEYRYGAAGNQWWTPVAWRFVSMPEVANG